MVDACTRAWSDMQNAEILILAREAARLVDVGALGRKRTVPDAEDQLREVHLFFFRPIG
jgi:hypothetical protein